ncbi:MULTISPECIES: hypothetical protein [unclassified Actinomadura]|uniref:hypothetical protein n=1 Tax=unclassified Actinomadura TaxID=2626254 RepID=UPI0011EF4D5D|nr:hypothetical protein [Actinomadura sp. K4S16]
MRRALLVTGVAALTLAGAANAADAEVHASPEAATAHSIPVAGNDAQEVKCYVHSDKRRGYTFRVRKAPRTSAGVIVQYHGKKLIGWKHGANCPQVEGGTYRCSAGEPKDNQWLVVNYKGRKGYVAAACTGGIGA